MLFRFFQVIHNFFYVAFGIFFVIIAYNICASALPANVKVENNTFDTKFVMFQTDENFKFKTNKATLGCLENGYITKLCNYQTFAFSAIANIYTQHLDEIKRVYKKGYFGELTDEDIKRTFSYLCRVESYDFDDNFRHITCTNEGEGFFPIPHNSYRPIHKITRDDLEKLLEYSGFFENIALMFKTTPILSWLVFCGFGFMILLAVLEYICFGKFTLKLMRKKNFQI